MVLNNLRVSVEEITADQITVQTDQGERMQLPKHLFPEVTKGAQLYLAADRKPLLSSEKQAKDILNEIIKE